jgi:hypothetical protein
MVGAGYSTWGDTYHWAALVPLLVEGRVMAEAGGITGHRLGDRPLFALAGAYVLLTIARAQFRQDLLPHGYSHLVSCGVLACDAFYMLALFVHALYQWCTAVQPSAVAMTAPAA